MIDPWTRAAELFDPPPPIGSRYVADPVGWINDRLGEFLWSKQREIAQAIVSNRRVAVPSCYASGKSFLAARIACWWVDTHKPGEAIVVTTASSGAQVKAILWKELGRAHTAGKLGGRLNKTEWWMTMPGGKEEMVALGRKPADMDLTAFQGIHAPYVLVVIDEAAGVPSTLVEGADSLIANDASRILAIGNPEDASSAFAEMCKPGSGCKVVRIRADETPNFTGERVPESVAQQLISKTWVEEKRRAWGEDSPMWLAKVLAEFPQVGADNLIPAAWVVAAQARELAEAGPVQLGVDVGAGGDRTTVACRKGGHVRIVRRDQNPDTMQTTGNVITNVTDVSAELAKVDMIGIGRGVVDRAKEISTDQSIGSERRGYAARVKGINVSKPASDSEAYINLRAEAWWGLRERFQSGDIDIDPRDENLAAQLVDIKFKRTSRGQIQIESKEEMKRRGRSSPDDADAVMLAFLNEPVEKKKRAGVPGRWPAA